MKKPGRSRAFRVGGRRSVLDLQPAQRGRRYPAEGRREAGSTEERNEDHRGENRHESHHHQHVMAQGLDPEDPASQAIFDDLSAQVDEINETAQAEMGSALSAVIS